jgi:hypothetical protein
VSLDHVRRDLKPIAMFGAHGDAIDQLIVVGEPLPVKLLLKVAAHFSQSPL